MFQKFCEFLYRAFFFFCKRGDLEFLGTKGTPGLGFEGPEWIQQAHDRDQLQVIFEPAERLRVLHSEEALHSGRQQC